MDFFKGIKWGWLFLTFFCIIILQTILNFSWVWVYSHFIETGGDQAFYEQYIFENRFWVNLFIVVPLFFLGAWWLGKKAGVNPMGHAIALFMLHLLFEISTEISMGDIPGYLLGFLAFNIGAFVANWLGGKQAEKQLAA